jgi:membrane-associated protease RseP (regulator of RpoE activity)
MIRTRRILALSVCILILVAFSGCATAPVQLNTSTGKPEIVVTSSKEAVADYITSVMLSWDYMIKNQAGSVLVFYKSTTFAAPVFPIWDTTPRPGEYRITYNLVNVSNGIRVMVSILGIKNPNTGYETQEEDRSKGTQDSVNVQNMLAGMKTKLEGSPQNNAANNVENNKLGKVGMEISNVDGKTITKIEDNSPAAKSGLMAGDIIISINGTPPTGNLAENISRIIGEVGTTCELAVNRNSSIKSFSIVRQKRPESGWSSSPLTVQASSIPADTILNIEIVGVSIGSGKIISLTAGGPAEKAGILKDDVITMIDGDPVSNNWMENAHKLVGKTNTAVVVTVKRGEEDLTMSIIRKSPL